LSQKRPDMNHNALMKVLIIDDDRTDREILKWALNQSREDQFRFAEATCAEAGLELCQKWMPDCVLLDFHLPDLDGMEALRYLTMPCGRPRCAVVMLTAFGGELLAVRAMKAGAMDYLAKEQIHAQNLPQVVQRAVERFRLSEQIELQRVSLEESWRRYQTLLEAIPHMVWVASADGRIEYANRQWCDYTGLDVGVADLGWNHLLHADDRESTWREWARATENDRDFEIEHRVRRAADGIYRWHLARAVRMRTAGGNTTWFSTYTDIQDQKQAEKSAREREKLESIGRLAGGIAHDFNNLLVGILGGADCAMSRLPRFHPAREMLETVRQSGEQAAALTRKMLAYAGKSNIFPELANVNNLVKSVCESVHASIPKNIRISFHGEPGLAEVRTDVGHLRQVVFDLLRNSVEAIGADAPGEISVTTALATVDDELSRKLECSGMEIAPGAYIVLEVRDTGCGMDEETQKKAFDPFFSTKSLGRGLGLAAVRGFVRSNGGGVQVESWVGKGALLRILLPTVHGNGTRVEENCVPGPGEGMM